MRQAIAMALAASAALGAAAPAVAQWHGVGAVTTAAVHMRARASGTATVVRTLPAGAKLHSTGQRKGAWMQVKDTHGHTGWISSAFAKPLAGAK